MDNKNECAVIKKDGKFICTTHGNVEMMSQTEARERGLTLDQPFLNALVCPVSGTMYSTSPEAEEFFTEKN